MHIRCIISYHTYEVLFNIKDKVKLRLNLLFEVLYLYVIFIVYRSIMYKYMLCSFI